jgi:hypothetical protein
MVPGIIWLSADLGFDTGKEMPCGEDRADMDSVRGSVIPSLAGAVFSITS